MEINVKKNVTVLETMGITIVSNFHLRFKLKRKKENL